MKNFLRVILLVTALVLVFSAFVGCKGNGNDTPAECVHQGGTATCTDAAVCELCGESYGEAKGHSHEAVVTAPTCTEEGYTTYTCACGDTYTADKVEANGHSHKSVVTAPTCTEEGYTTYTCACGDTYTADKVPAAHIDENLDTHCDREGCKNRVIPEKDTHISLFTANNLATVAVYDSYYVTGLVTEVQDAKNGIFIISDETGEKFLIRLAQDENGLAHANWEVKVVLGDTIQVYGPVKKFTSGTTFTPSIQNGVLTIVNQHEHVHSDATCLDPSICHCGHKATEALGHSDVDGNGLCDRCDWNMNLKVETIVVRTDSNGTGVIDTTAGTYTWTGNDYSVQVAKGTSSQLYSAAKDHMRIYKGNNLTISSLNGEVIGTVTITATNETQLDNIANLIKTLNIEYTTDKEKLTVTFEWNSTEPIVITNNVATTQFKAVEIVR